MEEVKYGDTYGRITVMRDMRYWYKGKSQGRRVIYGRCKCGTYRDFFLESLKSGHTKSCGCLQKEVARSNVFKHGYTITETRLYNCWIDMRGRSKLRLANNDNCNVYNPWEDFEVFRDWALSNGYDENKQLCRLLDTGDYSPVNARWDTSSANTIEMNACIWEIEGLPEGLIKVYNLKEWCKDNEIVYDALRIASKRGKYYKNLRAVKIGLPRDHINAYVDIKIE